MKKVEQQQETCLVTKGAARAATWCYAICHAAAGMACSHGGDHASCSCYGSRWGLVPQEPGWFSATWGKDHMVCPPTPRNARVHRGARQAAAARKSVVNSSPPCLQVQTAALHIATDAICMMQFNHVGWSCMPQAQSLGWFHRCSSTANGTSTVACTAPSCATLWCV